jgi:hypothetical protein
MADVIEVDAITGEVIERDFKEEELAQRELDLAAATEAQEAAESAASAVLAAKESAKAKLKKLGLTEDEIAAMITV